MKFQDEDAKEREEKEKKKKKKVKLEFHQDQTFRDGPDVYVWHFDPISWTKWLIGLGLGRFRRVNGSNSYSSTGSTIRLLLQ